MNDSRGSIQRIVMNTQEQSFHKQVTLEMLKKISVWESKTFLLYLFQKYFYDEHKASLSDQSCKLFHNALLKKRLFHKTRESLD